MTFACEFRWHQTSKICSFCHSLFNKMRGHRCFSCIPSLNFSRRLFLPNLIKSSPENLTTDPKFRQCFFSGWSWWLKPILKNHQMCIYIYTFGPIITTSLGLGWWNIKCRKGIRYWEDHWNTLNQQPQAPTTNSLKKYICTLKRDHFKRKSLLPTVNFQRICQFSGFEMQVGNLTLDQAAYSIMAQVGGDHSNRTFNSSPFKVFKTWSFPFLGISKHFIHEIHEIELNRYIS